MFRSVRNSMLLLWIFLFGIHSFHPVQAQQDKFNTIQEALTSGSKLSGSNGPRNVTWIDGGSRYSYMARNSETNTLEIRTFNPATGADELIFNNADFSFPGSDEQFTYDSFQWTNDARFIVFQSNFRPIYRRSGISDYYFYSVEDQSLEVLVKDAMTAELSPDGSKVGYEREGDLYVFDLNENKETRLTDTGKENFYNGRFGWVYEEEFGLAQAWSWSRDSNYIAFWQTDEREVKLFKSTDYSGTYPEYVEIPYPKVGEENPEIKIGVVDVNSTQLNWMDVPLGDGYVPRLYWTSVPKQLGIVHLNRPQNHLKLFFYDVTSGQGELVMEEKNENGWIDIFDFFAGVNHYFFFPEDRQEFFWVSERDGWNHIYRYGYDGTLRNQVTKGEWEVTNIHAVNSQTETIYFSSTEMSPLERHLYAINFDGSNKKRLTNEPGTHNINMGQDGQYYIDRYSNTEIPTQVELWSTDGSMINKLEENAPVLSFIENNAYSPRELFSFTTSDGQKLDGYLIKPVDFDTGKSYPLLLNIYGGPGAQGVYNVWESSSFNQWLAQQGYVIANVNNRGSGGYGHDFEKIVYKKLGHWEAHDFAETAKYLAETHAWIDGERIGIRGHSYGGYMSSYAMLTHPNVFKVGIVGAPVTDWRLYDTIYTERYMGLLDENEEGYIQSAPITHARKLKGKLFIAHSSMDENVHVQNTMQFVKALTDAGKDVDLRIYPPGAHGVAYNAQSYFLLYETYTDYLNKHLKQDS